ncbi:ABC transporter permease [Spirosoma sp. KUDC1026]|uniref:ABC transporter permease n=1 Tax=Spirosoma sp. KUDC1026 TaxID=2745947 RepID=UPI00159BDB1C|nr:ABC transporter permease [Spirosoma sp. KUDC1026]QKZ12826.1 ABC transporter permease [Spirosoma sp. KUDC1026]
MLQNFFKITFRNLWSNRVYCLINVGSLSLGLAVSMLILVFVAHEYSYDRFRPNANRIYRIWSRTQFGGQEYTLTTAAPGLGPELAKRLPGLEEIVRVFVDQPATFRTQQRVRFAENNFATVDPAFFDVFGVAIKRGNPKKAFDRPMNLVISEQLANQYYKNQDPIGQVLMYNDTLAFTVAGVMETPPSNSTLQFHMLTSTASFRAIENARRLNRYLSGKSILDNTLHSLEKGDFETYLLANDQTSAFSIAQAINDLIIERSKDNKSNYRFFLQSLTDIHLSNNFATGSDSRLVTILTIVAVLLIILALVNYMNLTTAQSTMRAKEIGVRKTSGASKRSLIVQFYGESFVTSLIGFAIAVLLVNITWPYLAIVTQQPIDQQFIYSSLMVSLFAGLFLICSLAAGSYPALLLASLSPVGTLKNQLGSTVQQAYIRKGLVLFQFITSVSLIISCLVIQQQVDFFRTMDIGLHRSQVLALPFDDSMAPRLEPYVKTLESNPNSQETTVADLQFFKRKVTEIPVISPVTQKEISVGIVNADITFPGFFKLQWAIEPKDINDLGSPNTLAINETTAKRAGITDVGDTWYIFGQPYKVVGILKDFVFKSLNDQIGPILFFTSRQLVYNNYFSLGGCVYIRTQPETDLSLLLKQIETAYQRFDRQTPFSYYFLDEAFNSHFKAEQRLSQVFYVITAIAIFIACLGLFGLAAFTADQRTKEIGVRKVLGASVVSIVGLLSKDFLKLVLVAIVIASPLAWYAMHRWLQDFAYRVDISWWIFALAGLLAVGIALLTVSFQSIKAALVNPVKSLKTE